MTENPNLKESGAVNIDPAALLGVVLAGALTTAFADDSPYNWAGLAIGVTLLLVLHAFDSKSDIKMQKSANNWLKKVVCYFTFGAVWSLCFMLIAGPLLELNAGTLGKGKTGVTDINYLIVWAMATLIVSCLRFKRQLPWK
ncbi:MAG: hypothetical protein KME14_14355 [Tildeniella torsiva UHER 1998/13D]|nr:hypothetical protein [Tildeniella torsiva UHER 1998/13D]